MIVDTTTLDDNLPQSIEAMFHVVGGTDLDFVRKVHRDFQARFPLESIPLIELNLHSTSQPFSLIQ